MSCMFCISLCKEYVLQYWTLSVSRMYEAQHITIEAPRRQRKTVLSSLVEQCIRHCIIICRACWLAGKGGEGEVGDGQVTAEHFFTTDR